MPAEVVDQGLRHVLDRCQPAGHVPVEGRVSDRGFALVGRGQDQPAPAVRKGHHQVAPDPGLQVLGGDPGRGFAQGAVIGSHRVLDRELDQSRPEPVRHLPGIGLGRAAGMGRGHYNAGDLLGPQRIRRQGGHEGGVDAAGKSEADVPEAVLDHVVPESGDERRVDLVEVIHPVSDRSRCFDRVVDQQILGELTGPGEDRAVRRDQGAGPVKDQLVLATDHVHHRYRQALRGGYPAEDFLPLPALAPVVGRSG